LFKQSLVAHLLKELLQVDLLVLEELKFFIALRRFNLLSFNIALVDRVDLSL
jgi:hypothetical protein